MGSVTPVPLCGATQHPQTRYRPTRVSARRGRGTIPERGMGTKAEGERDRMLVVRPSTRRRWRRGSVTTVTQRHTHPFTDSIGTVGRFIFCHPPQIFLTCVCHVLTSLDLPLDEAPIHSSAASVFKHVPPIQQCRQVIPAHAPSTVARPKPAQPKGGRVFNRMGFA